MKIKKAICSHCGKEYAYQNCGDAYAGEKNKESVYCPYCKKADFSSMTSGHFCSYKLDENGKPILF